MCRLIYSRRPRMLRQPWHSPVSAYSMSPVTSHSALYSAFCPITKFIYYTTLRNHKLFRLAVNIFLLEQFCFFWLQSFQSNGLYCYRKYLLLDGKIVFSYKINTHKILENVLFIEFFSQLMCRFWVITLLV